MESIDNVMYNQSIRHKIVSRAAVWSLVVRRYLYFEHRDSVPCKSYPCLLVQFLMMFSPITTNQIQHLVGSNSAIILFPNRTGSNFTDNALDFSTRHFVTCTDVLKDRFDTGGRDGVNRRRVELTRGHRWSYLDDVLAETFRKLLWIAAERNGWNVEVRRTVFVFDELVWCELVHVCTHFFCLYSSKIVLSLSTEEAHAIESCRLDMLAAWDDTAAKRRDDKATEIIVDLQLVDTWNFKAK